MVGDSVGGNPKWPKAWAGWAAYFFGWSIWFASLPLKADYGGLIYWPGHTWPPRGNLAPTSSVLGMLVFGPDDLPNEPDRTSHVGFYLCLIYYLSVLFCTIWPLIRFGPWWLRAIGRLGVFGALLVWVEVAYASQYYNFLALPGYPVLAIGSTLICLGVWLIPPRRKHKDTVASDPTSEPRAGTASGTGTGIGGE